MAVCGVPCNIGAIDLESLLVSLFAKDSSGCVGLKVVWLWGVDCEDLTPVATCGMASTLEQTLKLSIVEDGCGGWALGAYFVFPEPV